MEYDGAVAEVTMLTVLLDPGHGGLVDGRYVTPGKRYTFSGPPRWTVYEGVLNRKLAARVATLLLEHGVQVFDCVSRRQIEGPVTPDGIEQHDTSLTDRVKYANGIARQHEGCVLLSLHANAVGDDIEGVSLPARGFSAYTSRGQTRSDVIAERIYAEAKAAGLKVREDRTDGDADQEADFYMVKATSMPAVLVETGFFTNIDDARFLDSPEGIEKLATLLVKALLAA